MLLTIYLRNPRDISRTIDHRCCQHAKEQCASRCSLPKGCRVLDQEPTGRFSLREREDKAKYMMVLWLLNKTKKDDIVTPPAQSIATVSRSISEPVTMSSADSSLVTSAPAKKVKNVRSTATAMQMHCKAA